MSNKAESKRAGIKKEKVAAKAEPAASAASTNNCTNTYANEFLALKEEERHFDDLLSTDKFEGVELDQKLSELYEKTSVLCNRYAWAVPDERALSILQNFGPLIEIGAGKGYWASLLRSRGVDIVAFDKFCFSATSAKDSKKKGPNKTSGVTDTFTEVRKGGPEVLARSEHSYRNLFLCYPDEAESMAAECLELFVENSDAEYIIHVGEMITTGTVLGPPAAPFGRTSSADFQVSLAELFHCVLVAELAHRYPISRDCISVWKRTRYVAGAVAQGGESDEEEEEEELPKSKKGSKRSTSANEDTNSNKKAKKEESSSAAGAVEYFSKEDLARLREGGAAVEYVRMDDLSKLREAALDMQYAEDQESRWAVIPVEERLPVDRAAPSFAHLLESATRSRGSLNLQMLTSTDSIELNNQPFKVYPERWTALFNFFFLQMTNSLMWVTFAPIADITANFFGSRGFLGSLTAVNLFAVLFLVLYPFGTVIAAYTKRWYGLRVSLLIAAVVTVVGALLRFIGAYLRNEIGGTWAYILVFLGTFFVAIIQPIYINYPPTVSSVWFPITERDIATSIGSMSNPVGNAVGTLIPVFIVYQTTNSDNTKVVHGMDTLMLVQLIAVVVPLFVAWFTLLDSPPTPPSHTQSLKVTELSVHSTDALRMAHNHNVNNTVNTNNSSFNSSNNTASSVSGFSSNPDQPQQQSRALNNTIHSSSNAANGRLSEIGFEHELDDDIASFSATADSSAASANAASTNSQQLPEDKTTINTNSNRHSHLQPGRFTVSGRASSFFTPTRFSIFANADQGPTRHKRGSVYTDARSLFRNRDFVILTVTMALLLGMFSALLTVLYQLISHYGYSNRQAGVLGFVVIIAGLLGTIAVGFIMKRTRAYRTLLQGIVLAAVLVFFVTMCVMIPHQYPALIVCMVALGTTMLPVLPVMMENCAEIAYPISEELATGIVFSVSNIVGLIFIFVVQGLIPRSHYHEVSPFAEVKVFMGVIILLAAAFVCFYRGEYHRLQRDMSKKERAHLIEEQEQGRRSRASSFTSVFQRLRRSNNTNTSSLSNSQSQSHRRKGGGEEEDDEEIMVGGGGEKEAAGDEEKRGSSMSSNYSYFSNKHHHNIQNPILSNNSNANDALAASQNNNDSTTVSPLAAASSVNSQT